MAQDTKSKSFFAMTDAERDAEIARFDKGIRFEDTRPLSAKSRLLWAMAKRGRGGSTSWREPRS
jgi:hypothetical protein